MLLATTVAAAATTTARAQEKLDACHRNGSTLCNATYDLTHNHDLASVIDVGSIVLTILFIFFIAWISQRIVRRVIRRTISGLQGEVAQRRLGTIRRRTPNVLLNTGEHTNLRRAQRAETIGAILRSASTVVIFIIALFVVLKQFSFNLGYFIGGTAVATAALGFGAQNIVRDFLAGFFIVVEDQYGVGDHVDLGQLSGTPMSGSVEGVSLRITRLRDANGTLWHIPNGEIRKLGNQSQAWSRAVVEFPTTFDVSIPKVIKIMRREAEDMWRDSAYAGLIIDEPEVWAPETIDGEGIRFKLAVKVRPLEQWQISRTLRSRIKARFDEEGIRIATTISNPYGPAVPDDADA